MSELAASALIGTSFWLATHIWCHWRYAAMRRGDLEELDSGAPTERFARQLEVGVRLGTVDPDVANEAHARGLLSDEGLKSTLGGPYRRGYDRTPAAEIPWLPIYLGAALIGARISPACMVFMGVLASAAHCDVRFRVIPTTLAVGMIPLSIVAAPIDSMPVLWGRIVTALILLAMSALSGVLARRQGMAFGAGDAFLIAGTITATAGFTVFAYSFVLLFEMLVRSLTGASSNDIPLAAYLVAPVATSLLLM